MNIGSLLNINFSGKVEDKKTVEKKPYLPPQKPDTFEYATKPQQAPQNDEVINQIAKMYEQTCPARFDDASQALIKRDNLDEKKLSAIAKGMTRNGTREIIFDKSEFDTNNYYVMKAKHWNGESLKLLDKNLNVLEQESISYKTDISGNRTGKTVMTTDFRTNTYCKVNFVVKDKAPLVTDMVKIKRDAQGRLIRKETYEKSDVDGVMNVKYEFPDGKVRQLSKATVDKKSGHVLIEKDMRSSDMTRTQYRYEDDPRGNKIVDYKITSPDGKVLMKQSQSFEVLGENTFRTSRNDKTYLVQLNPKDNTLAVLDETKKQVIQLPLNIAVKGNQTRIANALKKLPGDELFKLSGAVVNINEVENRLQSSCGGGFYPTKNNEKMMRYATLNITDDIPSILHELGHAIDSGGKEAKITYDENFNPVVDKVIGTIRDDETFNKIYEQERQSFFKEHPTSERKLIDYFIADCVVKGQPDRAKGETIAETNTILNTYQKIDVLAMRTQYLQQHFPRTIAYLSEKLTSID